MKKITMFLLAVLPFGGFAQVQNFTIEGKVKDLNVPVAKVYVLYKLEGYGNYHRDSALVVKGKFTLKGTVPYAVKATLYISPNGDVQEYPARLDQREIYLENGVVTIEGADSVKNGVVSGTKLNSDFYKLTGLLAPYIIEEYKIHRADVDGEGNPEATSKALKMREDMMRRQEAMQEAFIKSHFNSLAALDLLPMTIDPAFNLAKAKKMFQMFTPELRASVSGKTYEQAFTTAIGVYAPDFSSKTPDGKEVHLSSYKGKYVLLDFWASWCLPCRAQNPALVKTYNKYKDQGFNVLGVSLDRGKKGKEMWLKAVAMDHLTWEQLSDLNGFNNEPVRIYQITAVPTNFLIDPTGKIIGKNLHGEELNNKLAAILSDTK